MRANFQVFSLKTVPKNYSWDMGTPNVTYTDLKTISSYPALEYVAGTAYQDPGSTNTTEVTGYAPFVEVIFTSTLEPTNYKLATQFLGIERSTNFGDYYNDTQNIIKDSTLNNVAFCHSYIMPGLYTIQFKQIEYVNTSINNARFIGTCLQKYCIEWSWYKLRCTPELEITWKKTKQIKNVTTGTGLSAKKWKFEPCTDDWAFGDRVYVEKTGKLDKRRSPLTSQWYNFLQTSPGSNNTAVMWASAGFQKPDELKWLDLTGPCAPLNYQSYDTVWKWDYITKNISDDPIHKLSLTWNETVKEKPTSLTWDYTSLFCPGNSINMQLSSLVQIVTKTAYIKIVEIPLKACIEVILQPEEPDKRLSPLTVRLSPKHTVCGSFPIEKIVWDMGDGSPLITQRRWAPTLEKPFVYSISNEETSAGSIVTGNPQLVADPKDPRNFDIEYTYFRTLNGPHTFYPSMTAYASSTGSFDSAAAVVGPLRFPAKTESTKVNLIQSELTEDGKVYIGEINNNVAVWRADK